MHCKFVAQLFINLVAAPLVEFLCKMEMICDKASNFKTANDLIKQRRLLEKGKLIFFFGRLVRKLMKKSH